MLSKADETGSPFLPEPSRPRSGARSPCGKPSVHYTSGTPDEFPGSMPLKRDSAKKYTSNPISGMGDLFGEPELPAGFRYIPDVISTADEKSLVQRFEKLPLKILNPQKAPPAIIRSRSADAPSETLALETVML